MKNTLAVVQVQDTYTYILVEVLWLLCIVYVIRVQPAEPVAQLVRASPSKRTVVGSNPTRGS